VDRAVEIARGCQIASGAKQHGGVAIMTAGMHATGMLRTMIEGVGLLDRQGIHIGAKANRSGRGTGLQDADNTGFSYTAMHLDAIAFKRLRNTLGSPRLIEAKLGMGMNVTPKGGQFVMKEGDAVDGRHQELLQGRSSDRASSLMSTPVRAQPAATRRLQPLQGCNVGVYDPMP
jgi:PPE-repeat protein